MVVAELIAILDLVFAPLTSLNPVISLLILSSMFTALVLLVNRFTVNRKLVREIKDKMEDLRERLNQAQKAGNKEETTKFLDEMMKANSQYMKQTFKALIISLLVISLFLPWLQHRYENVTVAKLPFTLPFVGSNLSWLLWYIFVSFAMGWVLRKIFVIDYA